MTVYVPCASLSAMEIAQKKVPGGKLVRVKVTHEGPVLRTVQITGDFFMYPESALPEMEAALRGVNVEEVEKILCRVMSDEEVEQVGVTPADIAELINTAVK